MGALTTVGPSATLRSVCGGMLSIFERDLGEGGWIGCSVLVGALWGWERSRR